MRSAFVRALALTTLLLAGTSMHGTAQEIRGRVVDELNRQAIADATVTLLGPDSSALARVPTDANGFFTVRVSAEGRYTIRVERIGFGAQQRAVTTATTGLTVPAFVLRAEAIELDSLRANARRRDADPALAASSRPAQIASGERLARLERQGARIVTAVRELSGAHVREWNDRNGRAHVCVEHRRRIRAMQAGASNACEWVVIVVDGITLGRDELTFRNLGNLQAYESVELVNGLDATRYGMDASANGALVLWTRGRGPYVDPARNRQ